MPDKTDNVNKNAKGIQKVLAPVDGSAYTDRVIDHLLKQMATEGPMELHLLNVQVPVDSGHARMFVSAKDVEAYQREEGLAALQSARNKLDTAGVDYKWHIAVGRSADTIIQFTRENAIDRIVMGTHGRSGLTHLLLGSVAGEVSRAAVVPVTLIK
ncbi:MAG: universal stress protein [Zoogloeaceae bacterium]|jgi:nucleotide-binding universal stress UspA family protein|nr:universal stress protein [Zoogloeaceae bacterium]